MTALLEDGPFCIAAQCGLCWFDFDEVDHIGIGPSWGQVIEYRRNRPKQLYAGGYRSCVPACRHGQGLPLGCHVKCIRILAPFRPDQFISVAKRVWLNPSPPSRAEWLRNQAAASLAASPRLPLEMRSEIAQHLLQEFAVCLLRTVRIGPTLEVRVDVSKTLDIEFVTYEGRSYIRNMTSSSRPTNCQPDTVYVAADTCGITDIIVCPANVRPCMDPVPGIWWSTILLTNPHTDIWLYTDGVKCRRVEYYGLLESDLPSWPTPVPPMHTRSFAWRTFRDTKPRQMVACPYSGPNVTGISVCCNPAPLKFHVHLDGEDSDALPIYKGTPETSSWTYYPLAKHERIMSMWVRNCRRSDSELGILIETSRKRAFVIGTQGWRVARNQWTLADVPEGEPATFHYDLHEYGARELVFTNPTPKYYNKRRPRLVPPQLPCPPPSPQEWYMWNAASTSGIISMRACLSQRLGRRVVRGLLFRYCDGLEESVGEVRFDSLTPPTQMEEGSTMWFEFDKTPDGCPHLVDVSFQPPHPGEQRFLMPINGHGHIEWWFSYRQCLVWHDGQVSPSVMEQFG